jgi:hypothetical protein
MRKNIEIRECKIPMISNARAILDCSPFLLYLVRAQNATTNQNKTDNDAMPNNIGC